MAPQNANDLQRAGTGFMLSPLEALSHFKNLGYDQNLVPCFDHFEVHSGEERLFPHEFTVDELLRFENTSDPDDQAILYAISSPAHHLKGVFMESYGLYHEDLSASMLRRLKAHLHAA